jgi:hypothetical protein
MEAWKKALLGGTALIGAGLLGAPMIEKASAGATDGSSTSVTGSAYHADASTLLAATSASNCTTTQVAVATLSMTITPPAGNFVYITGMYIEVGSNGTGSTASTTAWTSTGITNTPSWLVGAGGATLAGPTQQVAETYPPGGLKSVTPGTAVVLAPVATLASAFTCAKVTGYFSPL